MKIKKFIKLFAVTTALLSTVFATTVSAEELTVTDVAGRQVTLKDLPKRIILGEGRMMYSVAAISDGNPFEKIIGWKDDLIKYDPDAFRKFEKAFPEDTKRMVNFGSPYSGDFSIESVLANKADLVILDSGNLFKAEESGVIEKLGKAGVPVVFIDFRRNATENTVPSLLLLGRLLGQEKRTAEFLDFYIQQMRKVTNVVDQISLEDKPLVFIENAAGWNDGCCNTFGSYNYGRFVELAGGINYGSTKFSGYASDVSLEAVIAANPVHIIATGANWAEARPEVKSVLLGYDAKNDENVKRIKALTERDGFKDLDAVKKGNYHVIYHQFYNSPYHFVAVQQLAKWLHPEDFEDLDPQATFDELHKRFLPFENSGQFWISAEAK